MKSISCINTCRLVQSFVTFVETRFFKWMNRNVLEPGFKFDVLPRKTAYKRSLKTSVLLRVLVVLRSESVSGKCVKLYTGAASNNRNHPTRLLSGVNSLSLVHATYIRVLFFAHIPFLVNYAFNVTPTQRQQQCIYIFGWITAAQSLYIFLSSFCISKLLQICCLHFQAFKCFEYINWMTLWLIYL